MGARAEVFISATSADLGSYRQVAKEAVLTLGAHPIEEKNFPTDYSELQALLARRLDPCDAIIHLVGFYYGGEPKAPPDTPRRSWTQWEYYRATQGERHKPVYRFLARANCQFDAQPTEDAEKQRLQREHREHLKTHGGAIYYEFSTPEELRVLILSIDELRELVRPRRARIPFLPMREKFTGRRQFLETLQQDLTAGTGSVVAQPISVYADVGVGKTALAVELGWRLFEARQFDFVLFLNASTPETLDAELASLCASDALDLPEQTAKEQETRRAGVMRYLSTVENGRLTLLILDNADSDEARKAVRELLPKVATCAVLITSRFSGNLSGVRRQELALFDTEESREYLRTHLQPGLLAKASDQAVLDAVAEEVDHLPLALEVVVSYMHETNQSASEWLEEWHKTPDPTIKHYGSDNVNYPVSLAHVWEQSVGRLSHSARELMHWLVWMAPHPACLPIEVFKTSGDWLSLREVLSELAKASLILWAPAADEISIHRVLQAVTRNHLSEQEKTASLDGALATIQAALPSPEWDQKGWQLWEQIAPHCRALLNRLRDHVMEAKATRIMNDLALWLNNRAEHGEAEPLFRRALAIDEKSLGPEHLNVATGLNNLALLLSDTNRLAEAEPLFRRALAIDEKSLGPEHPNVARDLNNLALLLRATNRLAEAEPLFRRALAIDEKSLGPEHPNVARDLNNLALLLRATNRLAEAEPLFRRALAIDEKSLGPEHPNVARGLNSLALLLSDTNRLAEAEPLYRRALAITEKSLGPEHPNVARGLNNLALLLSDTNRSAEAEPLFRRALAIDKKSFGPDVSEAAIDIREIRLAIEDPSYSNYTRLGQAITRRMEATDRLPLDVPTLKSGLTWEITLPPIGLRLPKRNAVVFMRQKEDSAVYEPLARAARQKDAAFLFIIDIVGIPQSPAPASGTRLVWLRPEDLVALAISPDNERAAWLGRFITTHVDVKPNLPYQTAGAATEELFFGREEELARLVGVNPRGGIIVGAHRSGKSSLLYRLGQELTSRNRRVVGPLTMGGVENDFDSFFERTLQPLGLDLSRSITPEAWAATLRNFSKDGNRPVFLLDEVDGLLELDVRSNSQLGSRMRALQSDGHCDFYLAGHKRLREAIAREGGPFRNFAEQVALTGLSKAAALRLIKEPVRNLGFEFSDRQGERIFKGTGGVAVLIQEFCIRLLLDLRDFSQSEIKDKTIRAIERSADYLNEVFHHFYYGQTTLSISVMILTAIRGKVTRQALQHDLNKRGILLKWKQLDRALTFLTNFGVLEEYVPGHYRIVSKYLNAAIEARDPESLLEYELQEGGIQDE